MRVQCHYLKALKPNPDLANSVDSLRSGELSLPECRLPLRLLAAMAPAAKVGFPPCLPRNFAGAA